MGPARVVGTVLVIDYSSSARDVPSSTPTARCQTKRTSSSFFHTPAPNPSATPSRLSSYSSLVVSCSLSPCSTSNLPSVPNPPFHRSLHSLSLFFSLSLFLSLARSTHVENDHVVHDGRFAHPKAILSFFFATRTGFRRKRTWKRCREREKEKERERERERGRSRSLPNQT